MLRPDIGKGNTEDLLVAAAYLSYTCQALAKNRTLKEEEQFVHFDWHVLALLKDVLSSFLTETCFFLLAFFFFKFKATGFVRL